MMPIANPTLPIYCKKTAVWYVFEIPTKVPTEKSWQEFNLSTFQL